MAEISGAQLEVGRSYYFDGIGNAMNFSEYIKFMKSEVQEYTESVVSGRKPRPFYGILNMIATQDSPEMSDFEIRFKSWYVHEPKEVLATALAELVQVGLVMPTSEREITIPEKHRLGDRPALKRDLYYGLTDRAYSEITGLGIIAPPINIDLATSTRGQKFGELLRSFRLVSSANK